MTTIYILSGNLPELNIEYKEKLKRMEMLVLKPNLTLIVNS